MNKEFVIQAKKITAGDIQFINRVVV